MVELRINSHVDGEGIRMAASLDFKAWRRNHDDPAKPAVPAPLRHWYPYTRQDIIDIIRQTEAIPHPVPELHASGSHWALSRAAQTSDFILETQDPEGDPNDATLARLNRTLYEVVPDCMNERAIAFFQGQGMTPFNAAAPVDHSKFYLYHVEAGTRLYELYCRLDGGDPNPHSLASLLGNAYTGPWALPTMGGAAGQTIVGAFSTGTHGGDVSLGPLADAVQAIHLIGTEAREYWIERDLTAGVGLVDTPKLQKLYRGITVIRDPDVFNSVLVSVGRMGVVYSVVLRVVRQYALHETRGDKDKWSNVKTWVGNPFDPKFKQRFVQVVVNPNADSDNKDHSCWTTLRDLQPQVTAGIPPLGQAERCGTNAGHSIPLQDPASSGLDKTAGDIFNKICASDKSVLDLLRQEKSDAEDTRDKALLAAAAAQLAIDSPFTLGALIPLLVDVRDAALAVAAAQEALILVMDALLAIIQPGPLFNTLGTIANWCAENDHMEIFRLLADTFIGFDQGKRDLTAISYAILDVHNYLDVNCTAWGDSLEVFFDVSTTAASANLLAYVERLFQRNTELNNGWLATDDSALTGKRMAFPGYISLRFMGPSSALIAMQKWSRCCSLEIAGTGTALGTDPYLAMVERDALEMGATVHWGQRNNVTMKQLEKIYSPALLSGPLFQWRKTLSLLSRNGRFAEFSTAFTRQCGLEIVQPIVEFFNVVPANACEGTEVEVSWNAADNPPGTTMSLQTLPPGSSTPVDVMMLPDLQGNQNVKLPTGHHTFKLVASLSVSGRTLTDSRSIEVRGLQQDDLVIFILPANSNPLKLSEYWYYSLSLASSFSPDLKVESIICFFTGTAASWHAHRAGIPDVVFTPAGVDQPVPSKPTLQGDWWFYAPITTDSAPEFHVEFRVTCS
jgi:hypothetical protein